MKYCLIIVILWLCVSSLNAQWYNTTITSPSGETVYAQNREEYSATELQGLEDDAADWIAENNSDAERIGSASNVYNCHGFAWHTSEGGEPIWINNYNQYGFLKYNVDKYFSDPNSSYKLANVAE
ncbi:MAG: hypothetical protein PF436_08090 [Prolixibacteraceae bacterium]|jgi:hypothetical protein|nr:hypothetical protein [Prolixibacteraceae bacterium]